MTDEQAALLVKRLLGSYSSLSLHDPEVYITELVSVLMRYPEDVGQKGIATARKESPKFVPNVAEVEKQCESLIASQRRAFTYLEEWEWRSNRQLEERAQIEQRVSSSPGFLERIRDDLAAKGLYTMGAKPKAKEYTPAEVRAKLGLSRAQWDDLPDAPLPDSGYWEGKRQPSGNGLRQFNTDDLRSITQPKQERE